MPVASSGAPADAASPVAGADDVPGPSVEAPARAKGSGASASVVIEMSGPPDAAASSVAGATAVSTVVSTVAASSSGVTSPRRATAFSASRISPVPPHGVPP